MKRLIPFFVAALLLSSCLKEDAWCPTISLGFAMVDDYLEGDYDSRINNDVLLYIFNDETLVYAKNISYRDIAGGKRYEIPKTPELIGDLRFVAWAVKSGETLVDNPGEALAIHHPDRNPAYSIGASYNAQFLKHTRMAGENDVYIPHHHERYLGTTAFDGMVSNDKKNESTPVNIVMSPAPGRIVVNLSDPGDLLGEDAHVIIEGGMSQMGLGDPLSGRIGRPGSGTRANVYTDAKRVSASTRADGDDTTHSTDIFGVLPTEANSELKVHIMNGDQLVKTLRIASDNTGGEFTALHSGDYIVFDYNVVSAEVTVTINGFEERTINGSL